MGFKEPAPWQPIKARKATDEEQARYAVKSALALGCFREVLYLARSLETRAVSDDYKLDLIMAKLEKYAKDLGL